MIPKSEAVKQTIEKLKPLIGEPTANKYWLVWNLENEDGKQQIEEMLQLQYLKLFGERFNSEVSFTPIPKEEADGNLYIGDVVYNGKKLYPFKLRLNELPMHTAIFGRSGAGKSNTLFCMVTSLLKTQDTNTKILSFDFKREMRAILSDKLGKNLRVYTVGRNDVVPFCWNPLIPPSPEINANNWMELILDVLGKAFYVGDGAMDVLKRGISACYKEWGVYSNAPKTYPTFKDVYQKVESMEMKGRQGDWRASALRVLRALSFGELGKALSTPYPVPLDTIFNTHCVFELDSLSAAKSSFFTAAILLWVYQYELERFSKGNKPDGLERLVIIDEAHNVFPKHEGKETTMETMLRQARFLGCGIVLSDQVPSEISPIALANTMTHVNLNQKNRADINTAAANLLLTMDQKESLGHLKLGEAIVRIAGRYTYPFMISIPANMIKENKVTDNMVKAHMEGLVSSDWYSAYSGVNSGENSRTEPIPVPHKELTEEEKLFIIDIMNYQYEPISTRYKRMNISIRKGNRIKNMLMNKGLIETEKIETGTGWVLLSKLSKTGELQMKELGYNIDKLNGKAGLEHEYWRHKIADYMMSKGYKIEMEVPVNGETDIIATLPGSNPEDDIKIAIEIETGKGNIQSAIDNINKNLKAGYHSIISVATNKNALASIKNKLEELGMNNDKNIKIILINDFVAQ